LNLHLGKNVMLFSTYEITSSGGAPPAGARTTEETGIGGYDFTYGLPSALLRTPAAARALD
jgi:hypothetical protein